MPNTFPKLHNAMWPGLVGRLPTLSLLVLLPVTMAGCAPAGPIAAPGTPEWVVQSASIAAKKRDYKGYASNFTEKFQRDQIVRSLIWLTAQGDVYAIAEREGPESVKQVDAVLAKENQILKLVNGDWKRMAEVSALPSDEELQALEDLVKEVQNPAETWSEILKIKSETPNWYGRIESVNVEGDSASLKTYSEDRDIFSLKLSLARINGDWKIDSQTSAD